MHGKVLIQKLKVVFVMKLKSMLISLMGAVL